MKISRMNLLFIATLLFLAIPLVFSGNAGAMSLSDGAVQNGVTQNWDLPADIGWCYPNAAVTTKFDCRNLRINNGTITKTQCTTANFVTETGTTPTVYDSTRNVGRWTYGCSDPAGTTEAACLAIGGATWYSDGSLSCGNLPHGVTAPTNPTDCVAAGGTWGHFKAGTAAGSGICTGNWEFANYSKTLPQIERQDCLHCHNTNYMWDGTFNADGSKHAAAAKESTLKHGHKNMLRKVTAGKSWFGPDGLAYTTDGTNAINFADASITVSGTKQNLYYLYGDWMAALPSVVYGKNGFGSAPGSTNGYSCGACHTTGFNVSGTAKPEPQASFSGITGISGSWDLNGIQCARCHNADTSASDWVAGTSTGHEHVGDRIGDNAAVANLCFGCHQSIAKTSTGTDTTDPTQIPVGINHGASWGRDFNGHVLGNSFLNSPHGRFTGTIVMDAARGKYDLANNTNANYDSAFKYEGNACTGCHNVHDSIVEEVGAAKPLERECTECHTTVDLSQIKHPNTPGSPMALAGANQADACVICHMATESTVSMPAHLFRISTDASYDTFPTAAQFDVAGLCKDSVGTLLPALTSRTACTPGTCSVATATTMSACDAAGGKWTTASTNKWTVTAKANSKADGTYANAIWVDLDMACGQCHGGSAGQGAVKNGAPYMSKTFLSAYASGIHGAASSGTATAGVSAPVYSGANGMTVTVTDTSTITPTYLPVSSVTVSINWGDGSNPSTGVGGGIFTHTYAAAGNYTITDTASTSAGYSWAYVNAIVPGNAGTVTKYAVSGTVYDSADVTTVAAGVLVNLKNSGGMIIKQTTTDATGMYTFNVKNGGYTIVAKTITPAYKYGEKAVTVADANNSGNDFHRSQFKLHVGSDVQTAKVILSQSGVTIATKWTTSDVGGKDADGNYFVNFTRPAGTYDVAAKKNGVACTVTGTPVTLGAAAKTSITVDCP